MRNGKNAESHWVFLLTLLSVMFCVLFVRTAGAAEWKFYAKDQDENLLYYDQRSVTQENNVVEVWQKKVFSRPTLLRILYYLGERYAKLSFSLTLIEIHCPTEASQVRAVTYHNADGSVIERKYYETKHGWRKIMPHTDMKTLFSLSCEEHREWKNLPKEGQISEHSPQGSFGE